MNAAERAFEQIRSLCEQHGYSGASSSHGELLLWLEMQLSELDRRRAAAASDPPSEPSEP